MARTRMFGKIIKGAQLRNYGRRGGQSFLNVTRRPDLIHIPINLPEDILNGN